LKPVFDRIPNKLQAKLKEGYGPGYHCKINNLALIGIKWCGLGLKIHEPNDPNTHPVFYTIYQNNKSTHSIITDGENYARVSPHATRLTLLTTPAHCWPPSKDHLRDVINEYLGQAE
jgi:hypothetical protein